MPQGIAKPAIRPLARRGGVERISGLIYKWTRRVLNVFLENVIFDVVTYAEHAKRRTVTAMDVVNALKRQGMTIWLYSSSCNFFFFILFHSFSFFFILFYSFSFLFVLSKEQKRIKKN